MLTGKEEQLFANMLIIYHPIDLCIIQCRNATPASYQLATITNNRRLRTQLGKKSENFLNCWLQLHIEFRGGSSPTHRQYRDSNLNLQNYHETTSPSRVRERSAPGLLT